MSPEAILNEINNKPDVNASNTDLLDKVIIDAAEIKKMCQFNELPPLDHCECSEEQSCPICKDEKIAAGKGAKFDTGKLRYDLITTESLEGLASILSLGAEKYGPNNWKQIADGESRYQAAMMRHYEAYRKGDTEDEDSKQSHLYHCMCNIMFLIHFEKERNN